MSNKRLRLELESRKAEVMEGCAWSTTLLASGLADKVGEQGKKLETLVHQFAKLEGHKLLRIKV